MIGKSGVLQGRNATTYNLNGRKRQMQLADMGANVLPDQPIVIDKNIITSYNPATAFDVAFTLLESLTSKENADNVKRLMGFLSLIRREFRICWKGNAMELFIKYFVFGITLAISIGPVNIELIKRGLTSGFLPSWLVGIGGMTADFLILSIIYAGFGAYFTSQLVQLVLQYRKDPSQQVFFWRSSIL